MKADLIQQFPDPVAYRDELMAEGATQPLPLVPTSHEGLLGELPAPPPGRRGWPWDRQTIPPPDAGAEWPSITVVTPSYQQADYLEETIRSVLLQNYPRLEFIVVDGGSMDDSAVIIERYRPWLSFARTIRDRGQAHALNLGFSLAGGTLRGWLNSDDFYLPGALQRIAARWRSSRADVLYGDSLQLIQADGRCSYAAAKLAHGRYVKYPGLLPSHATFWTSARHQPLWELQHCALDYELWIRLLPGARVRHLAWPLAVAREHERAKTYHPATRQKWEEDAQRNGAAHPELYRPRPWLDFEYRIVQGIARRWRTRAAARTLAAVRRECAWPQPAST